MLRGYLVWARPVVQLMRASPLATHLAHFLVDPWAHYMAWSMGSRPDGFTWTGWLIMHVGFAMCSVIGYTALAIDVVAATVQSKVVLAVLLAPIAKQLILASRGIITQQ